MHRTTRGLLVALLLLIVPLAGCLSPSGSVEPTPASTAEPGSIDPSVLSQPLYDEMVREVVWTESELDGIRLYSEVFRPVTDDPVPVILMLSPYGGNVYLRPPPEAEPATGDDYPWRAYIDHFVPRGYAFVLADVRGTGNSEGCMNLMGEKEQHDAKSIVEHYASMPWSNGKVGMFGGSYDGSTPLLAATMQPEGLATIVPLAGVRSFYHAMYMGGVGYPGFDRMPVTYAALAAVPPLNVADGAQWAVNAAQSITFCDQHEEWQGSMMPGKWDKGLYTEYWIERDMTPRVPDVNVSVFYVQGFNDENVRVDHVMDYFNAIPGPKKAWLGQWAHEVPDNSQIPGAERDDWMLTLHAWFDQWLKDIDTGILETPTVEVANNRDELRYDTDWPPQDTRPATFYLDNPSSDGAPGGLRTDAPERETEATYQEDPAQANHYGLTWGLAADILRNAGEDPRTDRYELAYESEALTEELYLAGEPTVTLRAATDAENTHLLVFLYDVDVNGHWNYVSRGYWNLLLRDGLDNPQPVQAGEVYELDIPLHPKEYAFEEGHRIGLVVKSTDWRATTTSVHPATNTIVTGGPAPSALTLPLLDP